MVKEKVKKEKGLGHAKNLIIHMSGEEMEMIAQNIELQNMTILVGKNGVGKSLIMKLTWVLEMIAQLIIKYQGKVSAADLIEGAQFILDKSIPDIKAMAMLGIVFESGAWITLTLLQGKVLNVEYGGFEEITQSTRPVFMSSEMRLFSTIKQYLTLRKMLNGNQEKMLEHYKLYDLMHIEGMITRMPLTVDKQIQSSLEAFDIKGLTLIEFTSDDFIGTFDGNKKVLSQLGNGEQAMINIIVTSGL
jgi:hypothetical protein